MARIPMDDAATLEGGFADPKQADALLFDAVEAQQLHAHVRARIFGEADPVRIGRYTVLERIGAGGMGVVYAAFDNKLDRKIALKLMRRRDPATHARTLREAKAMARLSHPNVVQVHDVGEWRDRVFIAMEFVRGVTLGQWRTQVRDPELLLETLMQAGAGLAAAHEAGIVHRDFKSDNILVADDGRVRVVDFGIARTELAQRMPTADYARVDVDLTATGTVVGTPAYMAPEQFVGESVDARADQWAFGVVVHETLVGARPFAAEDFPSLREAVLKGGRRPLDAKIPGTAAQVIDRALQRRPEDRYPSMVALLLELRPAKRGPVPALLVGLVIALLFVAGGLTFNWKFGEHQLVESRAQAAQLARRAEGAEKTLAERDDALTLREARQALSADATLAVQTLAALSPDAWGDEARCILAEAQAQGIAETIWTDGRRWPESPRFDTGVLFREDRDRTLIAIDPLTLAERALPRYASVSGDGHVITSCDLKELWLGKPDGSEVGRLTLPDGFTTYLVSAGGRAVGLTTEAELRTYSLPALAPIASVPLGDVEAGSLQAIAPDGRSAYAIEGGRVLRVDALGVHELAAAQRGPVRTSADGRWIAAVANDAGDLVVWSEEGEEAARYHRVERYALSPTGHRLAVAVHWDGRFSVRVRDLAGTQTLSLPLDALPDDLRFSSDGRWLGALGDGTLTVWDAQSGIVMPSTWRVPLLTWRIDSAAQTLLAVDAQGMRVRWNLGAHRLASVDAHPKTVTALAYDGSDVVSGDSKGNVVRWTLGKAGTRTIAAEKRPVIDISVHGPYLGVGTLAGGAVFFEDDQERGRIPYEAVSAAIVVDPAEMTALRSHPTSLEVVREGRGAVTLHESEAPTRRDARFNIESFVAYKGLERGGDLVAMRHGASAMLWRAGDSTPRSVSLPGDRHYPSRDGSSIANSSWEGTLVITDLEGTRIGGVLGSGVENVLDHGAAEHVLLELKTGDLAWWRARTGRPCALGQRVAGVRTAVVASDEQEIALGTDEGRIVRVPMPSGLTAPDPAALVESLQPTTIGDDEAE